MEILRDFSNKKFNTVKSVLSIIPCSCNIFLAFIVSYYVRFYTLHTIHKLGILFRPTNSNIGFAPYKLEKYLASIYIPILGANSFTIKNSHDFVKKLLEVNHRVSFDIKSLFINIPIREP